MGGKGKEGAAKFFMFKRRRLGSGKGKDEKGADEGKKGDEKEEEEDEDGPEVPECIEKEAMEKFPDGPPKNADDCKKVGELDTSTCDADTKKEIADYVEGGCKEPEGKGK